VTLLAALAANPDDVESYRVLADELQSRDDPRGELIALQLARETERNPTRAVQIDDAIAAHFHAHGERILGPLRRWTDEALFSKHWTWRRGFLDRLDVDEVDPARLLVDVFAHPAGQLLRALAIACNEAPLELVARRAPTSVRSLTLDTGTSAAAVWQRFPYLRQIDFTRCELGIDEVPHIVEARLGAASVTALRAHWPALVKLTVEVDPERPRQSDLLMEMLGSRRFPGLTHLSVPNCRFAEGFVLMLSGSLVGEQLEALDLLGGSLNDAAARAWAARPPARKLKRLRVRDNSLSFQGIEALAAVAEHVIVRQRDELR
jgi:uncharacterized protein (TIGR02996 family)